MLLIKTLIVIILVMIFVEDMRSRAVHWYWFPLLVVALLFLKSQETNNSWKEIIVNSPLLNAAFLTAQLILLTLYFSIKEKKLVNITKGLLGWGDILFLLCIAAYASPINFIIYHVLSLVIVLLLWAVYSLLSKKQHQHIPLAGLQACIFAVTILFSWIIPFSLTNDDVWIRLINSEV